MLLYQDDLSGFYVDTDSDDDLVLVQTNAQRKRLTSRQRSVSREKRRHEAKALAEKIIDQQHRRKRTIQSKHVTALQRVLNFVKSNDLYWEMRGLVEDEDVGKPQLRRLLLLLTQLDTLPGIMTAKQEDLLHVLIHKVRDQLPKWDEWQDEWEDGWDEWTTDRELLDTLKSKNATSGVWWARQQLLNNWDTAHQNQTTIQNLEGKINGLSSKVDASSKRDAELAEKLAAQDAELVAEHADLADLQTEFDKQADILKQYRKKEGSSIKAGWQASLQTGRVGADADCDQYHGPFCEKDLRCYRNKCINKDDSTKRIAASKKIANAWRNKKSEK